MTHALDLDVLDTLQRDIRGACDECRADGACVAVVELDKLALLLDFLPDLIASARRADQDEADHA